MSSVGQELFKPRHTFQDFLLVGALRRRSKEETTIPRMALSESVVGASIFDSRQTLYFPRSSIGRIHRAIFSGLLLSFERLHRRHFVLFSLARHGGSSEESIFVRSLAATAESRNRSRMPRLRPLFASQPRNFYSPFSFNQNSRRPSRSAAGSLQRPFFISRRARRSRERTLDEMRTGKRGTRTQLCPR